MTTVLEEQPATTSVFANPALRLRIQTAAVRVSLSCFGTRKTLSTEQKARAADTFGAEGDFLSAGKKLLDTKHPAFKAVTAIKNRITSLWKGMSLPFPEPGIRLVNSNDQLDELVANCQQVVRGVAPQQLRADQSLRQQVTTELSRVQSVLDGLLVDRPLRNILRRPR